MSEGSSFSSLQAQIDEVEVLQSIYGDAWQADEDAYGSYAIKIVENKLSVDLFVTLPENYPHHAPPVYTLSAPSLSKQQKDQIQTMLNEEYLNNIGSSVLYQWIEKIRDFLLNIDDASNQPVECALEEEEKEINNAQVEVPTIVHGEVISDRKSSFQGHLARIQSLQEVRYVLAALKANKKVANATHNMYAYRFSLGGSSLVQDCEDDGETQAGSRLLHLLQTVKAINVVVVVSRWYGGILLGPARFRHINNAARQVLVQAKVITPVEVPVRKRM